VENADIFASLEYGPAPESRALALSWLEAHGRRFDLFIGGEWRAPVEGETFTSMNPADGRPLATLAQGSSADVAAAVDAAGRALPAWSALPGHARARYLHAIARQVQKHAPLFAVLESLDNGRPIRETRDLDIPRVIRHFQHHAGWARLRDAELPGYQPVGVVGQIIPSNSPLLMLAWKIAPALAMGNTVVLKPAEFTPLTALRFAELCREVGLPPGVVNIVTGDARTGEALVADSRVEMIAFTGSTRVGRIIRRAMAGTGRKLSMVLGGMSPFIVFDDADLDSVVEGVVDAIWCNQGGICCAGSSILVHEGTARRLTEKLRARMENLRIGDPLDRSIDIGAIVAPVRLERIEKLVEQAVREGATLWQPSWSCPEEGCFHPPTLFTDVAPANTIANVEILGPVVVLMTFRTPGEAVHLANDRPHRWAASVWTESVNLAFDVASRLRAGTVWINCANVFDASSGFGGRGESGSGNEGGKEGLYDYLRPAWERDPAEAVIARTRSEPSCEAVTPDPDPGGAGTSGSPGSPTVHRTARLYIGGKQARPDGGSSLPVFDPRGRLLGEFGRGNGKDLRKAVEAARASSWGEQTSHARAQILHSLAEHLSARGMELRRRLAPFGGENAAALEVELSVERLFLYAAHADRGEGRVLGTPHRMVTLAMREAVGVLGVVCPDEAPLLGFISTVAPALALGNRVIAVPSERVPLLATDFYQIADDADLPPGALNIVTGLRDELVGALAGHPDLQGLWYFAADGGWGEVERLAAENMKKTWIAPGRDWTDPRQAAGEEFMRNATAFKNIWVPYGE